MPGVPILSKIWSHLTTPSYPRTSISISETHLALVTLKRQRGEFEPVRLASVRLPAGLVRADFAEPNLTDESALIVEFEKLAAEARMQRFRKLAVALPEGSARSMVVSLDSLPASAKELSQVLNWRIERSIGCKPAEVRIAQKRLDSSKGHFHWLVTVTHNRVIEQYERFFHALKGQVGLILPTHLAEAQWLLRAGLEDDQVMISLNDRGFVAVIVRNSQPILVRDVLCSDREREDEFHRLMIFYRDRLQPENGALKLNRLLVVGPAHEQQRFQRTLADALEAPVTVLDPGHLGFRLQRSKTPAPFSTFAAAAGLATLGWG